MAAKREKTNIPGVYRRGARYAVIYRDPDGKQRQESARTLDEARRLRTRRVGSVDDGSYQPVRRERFADYAREWIGRCRGSSAVHGGHPRRVPPGSRALRDPVPRPVAARSDGSRQIAEFVAWMCDAEEQGRRRAEERRDAEAKRRGVSPQLVDLPAIEPFELADKSVRRILAPVRSCLGSAKREDLVRFNPCAGAIFPKRDEQRRIEREEDDLDDDGETDVKALTTEQLALLLEVTPASGKLLIRLLAATGLRIGEALALRWGDLVLDGTAPPAVKVRRSVRHGQFEPPKSRFGRRTIPIDFELVRAFRAARPDVVDERGLVFCPETGGLLDYSNLRRRVLLPAARKAGVEWMGFHTLRHTYRDPHVRRGTQHQAGAAPARASLAGVHAEHVRSPA